MGKFRDAFRAIRRPADGNEADAFVAQVVTCLQDAYYGFDSEVKLRNVWQDSIPKGDQMATFTDEEIAALTPKAPADDYARSVRANLILAREIRKVTSGSAELRRDCILRLAEASMNLPASIRYPHHVFEVLAIIARKRVPWAPGEVTAFLTLVREAATSGGRHGRSWWAASLLASVAKQIEAAVRSWSDAERARIAPVLEEIAGLVGDHKLATRLRSLVTVDETPQLDAIVCDDDVGKRLRAAFVDSSEKPVALARALELFVTYPGSGKPTKKWLASSEAVRSNLDDPAALVAELLDALLEAADWRSNSFLHAGNEPLACGIAVFAGGLADATLLPHLRRLAVKSVTVIGGESGFPRSLRLANTCARAIADAGAADAITASSIRELLALERSVRHGALLKQVRKAIDALASARGMTRDELLEQAVEDHGLDPDGRHEVALSRGFAVLEIDARTATLAYVDDAGARKKSFPADVKEADAERLAALRTHLKAVRKTIVGERHRLDGLMARDRRWPFSDWRARYLDHPVTGRLTRTLIWGFRGQDGTDLVGMPVDEASVVASGGEHVAIPADAEVRLWHPVHVAAEDIRAWRLRLLDTSIAQPFKQAFRELYVLTPAEARTSVYSNRFAGHVIRQIQARALMKGRNWVPSPLPIWWWETSDHPGIAWARRGYEPFGVRAEFLFDPILDIEPDTDTGNTHPDVSPYCTSDQVRFFDTGNDEPIALADVPPLVFTEAMRDIDLFIGVTSIGADPEWLDRGAERRFETYWHSFGFGDLNASAKVRRDVLEQLLPRLAIADRCELEERYLAVRGDIRTYRIHLGSGNILMLPNDQYLCIVAARDRRAGKLFLPFDDDPVLSLVLSKAFLLAEDAKITDQTITRQITGA